VLIKRSIITFGAAITLLGAAAQAQDFDLGWHTIDGGGAMSSKAGAFELSGTIGQPDAGPVMTGGDFELAGGFWPGTIAGGCNGNEKIKKAKCKTRKGKVKKVIVRVKKGTPGQEYTAKLDTGEELTKSAKSSGKVKFTFKGNDAPPCGANGVTVCDDHKDFNCEC